MFVPIIAGIAGMWAASRGKPTSKVNKRQCLGPRSGLTYEVDEFTETGVIMIHAHGAVGTFIRKPNHAPGFKWVKGDGNPQVLAAMIRDFT